MIKLILCGVNGRMGRTVYKTLIGSKNFEIVFGIDRDRVSDMPFPVYRSFEDTDMSADVIIDFSAASALDDILAYAVRTGTKLVLATTGHSDEQLKRLEYAAKSIPVFKASNMSLGVNLLANLSKSAMKFLGDDYDVEIVETHHNKKLDAPSGTALSLAQAINEVRNGALQAKFGRHETAHRREKSEIGIHAVRGGTVVGKHDVMFLGQGEQIKLSHEAESKEVFVHGALRAASFLTDKQSGIYDMYSILGDFHSVTTVGCESDVSVITLPDIDAQGFLSLLAGIKDNDINLDMISQSINAEGNLSVSFSLSDKDMLSAKQVLSERGLTYSCVESLAKMSAEGAGMEHRSGVALEVLSILKNLGARIYAVTTSETKISCAIDKAYMAQAEAALRTYYNI